MQKAKSLLPELKRWRRHLHEYPELSFQEYETQRFLLHELEKISGIRVKKAGNTGIVADLITAEQGPWIALRADMDALPIQEIERPHCSKRAGIMHACGHDAHTAMLLGAAHLLWGERRSWQGGIRLIFQPGEEKAPGGASLLLQEGILDEVPIQAIWAQHVTPQLPVGKIGLRSGPFMAASDEFHLTLKGPGGHAAYPHLTPDPIAVGSQLITHLQQVVSRAADPRSPTVLTFGKFQAGSAPNIIPTEAALAGTLRTFDEGWRRKARELITHLVHSTAEAWGLHAHLTFYPGYPVLQNDPSLTTHTRDWCRELLGPDAVEELPLWLSSEDFAFYSQKVPACFIRLGTAGIPPHSHTPVHTPTFDIDEEALPIGVAILTHIAIRALERMGGNA